MTIDLQRRFNEVDQRLEQLFDKQDREELTDDEVFEQQKLLDEFDVLINQLNSDLPAGPKHA